METRIDDPSFAAGTKFEVLLWNAQTYEQVLKHEEGVYFREVLAALDATATPERTFKRQTSTTRSLNLNRHYLPLLHI